MKQERVECLVMIAALMALNVYAIHVIADLHAQLKQCREISSRLTVTAYQDGKQAGACIMARGAVEAISSNQQPDALFGCSIENWNGEPDKPGASTKEAK